MNWMGLGQASIIGLLFGCFPTTVKRLVWPIVVNAAKRIAFWLIAHISMECRKRFNPLRTNRDAAPTPTLKVRIVRIKTALFHSCPRLILTAVATAMTTTGFSRLEKVLPGTPTRLCSGGSRDNAGSTAITESAPVNLSFWAWVTMVEGDKYQPPLSFPSPIPWLRSHMPIITFMGGEYHRY